MVKIESEQFQLESASEKRKQPGEINLPAFCQALYLYGLVNASSGTIGETAKYHGAPRNNCDAASAGCTRE